MNDDGLIGKSRIDVDDPHDVAMWGLVLGVTPAAVIAAVEKAGPYASHVRAYLKSKPGDGTRTRPASPPG